MQEVWQSCCCWCWHRAVLWAACGQLQQVLLGKGLQFAKMPEDKAHLCLVWPECVLQDHISCICSGEKRMVNHSSASLLLWKKFVLFSFRKVTVQLLK